MADKQLTFRVYDFDVEGKEHDTGKQFTITQEEHRKILGRGDFSNDGILLAFFYKVFGFTNANGFYLQWDLSPEGKNLDLQQGTVHWRSAHWRLKRVEG